MSSSCNWIQVETYLESHYDTLMMTVSWHSFLNVRIFNDDHYERVQASDTILRNLKASKKPSE